VVKSSVRATSEGDLTAPMIRGMPFPDDRGSARLEVEPLSVRPLVAEDLQSVYLLGAELGSRWVRVFGHFRPPPHTFRFALTHDVLIVFVVEERDVTIGCGALYDYNESGGTVWCDLVIADGVDRREAIRTCAAKSILDSAFRNWQVRKVYFVQCSCESPMLALPESPLREEGRLTETVFHGGELHSEIILASYRADWLPVGSETQ
jgi:hypothetical protein